MVEQKWYQSKVALSGILAQLLVILGLLLTQGQLTIVSGILYALLEIWSAIAIRNNPTNPIGWDANTEHSQS
jgi:hypothetical protein